MSTRALVVGAGPAGLGAALELATWCDSVTVAEAAPRSGRPRAGEHLPPAALSALASIGLGAFLVDGRHDRSPGVRSAWGEDAPVDKEYFSTVQGSGLNLRRELFDESLAGRVGDAGVDLRFGTRLQELERAPEGYRATLQGPEGGVHVEADVVVDASGRNAVAARKLGAKRRRYDGLVGLQGRIEGCEPTDEAGRVHIESVRDGWWYGVVFSDGTLLATLMTDATLVRDYDGSAADLWERRLEESRMLGPVAGSGRWSGSVQTFDAATQVLDFEAPVDLLAVGDAAAAWDPLSSWGITKGLCDGHAGAQALARERGGESGSVASHRATQQQDFESYRSRQLDFYRAETRWSASPFWRARQHDSRRSDHREGK